jgi:TerC family integral membrane protein
MNGSGSNGHAGPHESQPPRSDEKQNLVLEVLPTVSTEVIAETLEVAAKTVSVVGEIEMDPSTIAADDESLVEQDAAVRTVVFWVGAAVAFGTLLFLNLGSSKASEFFAGYLLEQSLSVDNLFVFVVIFNYFKTPLEYQSRVLTYGIAGAVFFRGVMISLGAATLQRFEAVNLFFAAVLLFSAYKLFQESEDDDDDLSDNFIVNLCKRFIPVTSTYDGNNFFIVQDGLRKATPLLLTLAVVELSDVAFAVDSIPAVFGVTRDPLIVFSSNMFAILGLRSLYTLISGSMAELEYLQPSVAGVLGFIGTKMVAEYFGLHVSTEASLGVVALLLGLGIGLSILAPSKDDEDDEEEET